VSGDTSQSAALEAVEQVLAQGGEADEVLRGAVVVLHERLGRFVRVSFVEGDGLVPGPAAGEETPTTALAIRFDGTHVADLETGGELADEDRALLERVSALLAPYALVGWDTGGEPWEP
jgi:hypothetical protein